MSAVAVRVDDGGEANKKRVVDVDSEDITTLLSQYYQRFFPAKKMYRWLSYGNGTRRG